MCRHYQKDNLGFREIIFLPAKGKQLEKASLSTFKFLETGMVLVKMKEGRTKFRKGASRASYILLNLKLKSQVNVAPSALS